jgi:hypothetical protein
LHGYVSSLLEFVPKLRYVVEIDGGFAVCATVRHFGTQSTCMINTDNKNETKELQLFIKDYHEHIPALKEHFKQWRGML